MSIDPGQEGDEINIVHWPWGSAVVRLEPESARLELCMCIIINFSPPIDALLTFLLPEQTNNGPQPPLHAREKAMGPGGDGGDPISPPRSRFGRIQYSFRPCVFVAVPRPLVTDF